MNVKIGRRILPFRTVRFDPDRNAVLLIEQRLLPHKFKVVTTRDFTDTARAIRDMIVRGAGAIGATAAYGFAQGVRAFRGTDRKSFEEHVEHVFETLKAARPTAIDPVNAMLAVRSAMDRARTIGDRQQAALEAANRFAEEDVEHCRAIGQHGLPLIREGMKILTHCNAGWLAFVDIGSATAPLYAAQERGIGFHVWVSETRPRSQGATLTAWELAQQGIPHHVIADNAAGHLMQRGEVDMVIVGSDRVLGRTGDVANKIGTYTRAVLAWRHSIPFYVAIPLSTIDWTLSNAVEIPIEERNGDEVLCAWGTDRSGKREQIRVANPTSEAVNPGFDITPAELITGIITPVGIFKPQHLWKNRRKLEGQEAGGRSQEAGVRGQETGDRRQKPEVRGQRSEVGVTACSWDKSIQSAIASKGLHRKDR